MEERTFLSKICLAAISASKFVNFAAVMDVEGKLIVAKYKDIVYKQSYLFYLNYLAPAIKKWSLCSNSNDNPKLQFQSLEITDNIKIAKIKLPKSNDKYLCVCVDSPISYNEGI